MAVTESMENGVLTMKVSGRLNAVTSLEFHDKLMQNMPDARKLILDFTELDYISSGGLRELLIAYEEMCHKDGMEVINVGDEVRGVLDMTGFSTILQLDS